MRNLSILFALTILFSSCACFEFSEPEMRGGEKINVSKVNGKKIEFTAEAKIFNPNCFTLKVKPSMMDLYVEGEYMGKVKLNEKVKLKKKKESQVEATFTAELSDGALMKAMKFATKKEVKVRLKGKVKGGVFIFSKKFEMDETKTIPGASFGMK